MIRKISLLTSLPLLALIAWSALHAAGSPASAVPDWAQWGHTSLHNSATSAIGQSPTAKLADIIFDPFVSKEKAESGGELLAHYQVPLVDGNSVFLEVKTGKYVSCDPPGSGQPFPCGPDDWRTQIWNERGFIWKNGALVELWNFKTDWKPELNTDPGDRINHFFGWEPVFHSALWNGFVFVPGLGGTIYKLKESDGTQVAHYNPFSSIIGNRFVSGPLTIDSAGNVYYNVLQLDPTNPWSVDVKNSWLVKVTPGGSVVKVSYSKLSAQGNSDGSQRPAINLAPAVSADGATIYTATVAHFNDEDAYFVAVNSNLTPRWHTSLTNLDNGQITGLIFDLSTASPVVLPDGNLVYGVLIPGSNRGAMLKFSASGQYMTSFDFGWDDTPAVYKHDGTYSIVTKNNFYDTEGPYYITQLNSDLVPEWNYKSADNFEWCVNAPAVDGHGTIYADSEDGNLFVIPQGGKVAQKIFLQEALGAAYTPVAIGHEGKIYTMNNGDVFVVGK
jgi:hypothetical protein